MWSLRILLFCLSVYFANAVSDLSQSSNIANSWTCDGDWPWIRSAPSADISLQTFIQLDKASCVFSPTEKIPVCLATAKDGRLWEYAQGLWWRVLKPKMPLDSKPSCLVNRDGNVECFLRGFDGVIWRTERMLKSYWTDFTSLGGSTAEAPSCVATDTQIGICFYKAFDGTAYYSKIDDKELVQWTQVGKVLLSSSIRCFKDVSNSASCVALDASSRAISFTWNGMSSPIWTQMTPLEIRDTPGCARQTFGERVDCFTRGVNNTLMRSVRQSGGSWTEWTLFGKKHVLSEVECVEAVAGRAACYYVSVGMKLKSIHFENDKWHDHEEYNSFYMEDPSCTATLNMTVFCAGRAVLDLSRQICELLDNGQKT